MLWDSLESSFNVKFFGLVSLSRKHLHPFHHNRFPQLCWWFWASLHSCGCTSRVSQTVAVLTFPQAGISSVTPFTVIVTTFNVFAVLPLSIIHICNTSHGFVAGKQGGNTPTHFAVCVLYLQSLQQHHTVLITVTLW